MNRLFAGVEAGGTKFVCGVGRGPQDILARFVTPTGAPRETLARVIDFFAEAQRLHGPVEALGVASFGPLDLDSASPCYGSFARTPKPGWSGFDLRGELEEALGRPAAIDVDVAGAGMAEAKFGAGRKLRSIVYVTVGTGVGGAVIVDGAPLHRSRHPEMGHLLVRKQPLDANFAGICPYHDNCLEGLACGPAIIARAGADRRRDLDHSCELPRAALLHDHPVRIAGSDRHGGRRPDGSRHLPAHPRCGA